MLIEKTLKHSKKSLSDEDLAKEAVGHFGQNVYCQFQAEIFVEVRPWFSSQDLNRLFPVSEVMKALAERPDLRQIMATTLAGTRPNRARLQDPEKQAKDIDESLASEDISLEDVEKAITPETWSIYVFGDKFWQAFSKELLAKIVEANGEKEKKFISFFLDMALKERRYETRELKPVLTHLDVVEAIDGTLWQQRIPIDKRVEVDKARRAQERKNPRLPFTAKQELTIVGIKTVVDSFDLTDFVDVVRAAGNALGFGEEEPFADLTPADGATKGPSPKA